MADRLSRASSFLETLTSTVIGFLLSVWVQRFPRDMPRLRLCREHGGGLGVHGRLDPAGLYRLSPVQRAPGSAAMSGPFRKPTA